MDRARPAAPSTPAARSARPLTAETILARAEEVLRRQGPADTTVLDVTRALGVSDGEVYRCFASRSALYEAIVRRSLQRASARLDELTARGRLASIRLGRWLDELFALRRRMALEDPQLLATYALLARENIEVVAEHREDLAGQIAYMIGDGVAAGELRVDDIPRVSRALLDATTRFHDPVHAGQWSDPAIQMAFAAVRDLLLAGLRERGGGP